RPHGSSRDPAGSERRLDCPRRVVPKFENCFLTTGCRAGGQAGLARPTGERLGWRIVRWRSEPFRAFFPLGVLLGWVGIGHWLLYSVGMTTTYSCMLHGLVQTQAFLMAVS